MVKRFSEDYKTEAVKMVIENNLNATEVSKDLGIGQSTLKKWISSYRANCQPCGISVNEREELRQLKAENHKLKLERDLLKKATIFFASDRSN
jgi:transposase